MGGLNSQGLSDLTDYLRTWFPQSVAPGHERAGDFMFWLPRGHVGLSDVSKNVHRSLQQFDVIVCVGTRCITDGIPKKTGYYLKTKWAVGVKGALKEAISQCKITTLK